MDSKNNGFNDPYNPTPEEIKAYYEKAKREFTLEDLKPFLVQEEGQPFSELVAELELMVKKSKLKGEGNESS